MHPANSRGEPDHDAALVAYGGPLVKPIAESDNRAHRIATPTCADEILRRHYMSA